MLDPCDLCPLFSAGHDVPPVPRPCLECPYFRSFGKHVDAVAKAPEHPEA